MAKMRRVPATKAKKPAKKAKKTRSVAPARPKRVLAAPSGRRAPGAKRPKATNGKATPRKRAAEPRVRPRAAARDTAGFEPASVDDALVDRWVSRGEQLLATLVEHGVDKHEVRSDLRDGRFVWLDEEGLVSAEARAEVLCSWSKTTRSVVMAWADPLVRAAGVRRLDGIAAEHGDVTEADAWRIAMQAAEATGADYLYRLATPHAWYYLALRALSFTPLRASFTPGTPVSLVLQSLVETRQAIESRAEPAATLRERLATVGDAMIHNAEYAYRDTDWVARLERTGRRLLALATRLPRPSYRSIAAGHAVEEWLSRDTTIELAQALALLEDEWSQFG